MIVDCHVNIWEDRHVRPLFAEQMARIRPGGMGLKADADTLYRAMSLVDRAIVFALRHGDSAGVERDDETTADAVRRYPETFVGFAYDDPRMTPVYDYCVANDLPLTMHMGTTFARTAPVDLGRAIHVEPVALRYPDLKMILAHMGHPWYEDTIAVIRKQPNVYAEVSALYYRPWQFYNIMITAQEYLVTDKIFFGTDYPFSTVENSLRGIRAVNDLVEGTRLPRVSSEVIEGVIHANPFEHWWHGPAPA